MLKKALYLLSLIILTVGCASKHKEIQTVDMIKKVTPTEQWELIIELSNSKYLIIKTESMYDKGYDFLAYPNQLKAFTYDDKKITWKNGKSISINEIKEFAKTTSLDEIKNKNLRINYKNQAPTKQHKSHHVYGVYLYPFKRQINIGESIGGGHAERGGSVTLSITELLNHKDWENHFLKSDCEWAIRIIKSSKNSEEKIFDELIKGICTRSNFNKN